MSEALDTKAVSAGASPRVSPARDRGGWFAGAAALGAVVASSCCIGPLLLVMLGVSGAWIGNLVALEPYMPYFLVVTALLLGAGFRTTPEEIGAASSRAGYPATPVS